LNQYNLLSLEMCGFNPYNQILLNLFDISNAFQNYI